MKRLPMRKIRDALRLRANGLSMREIAASLGVGQSTLSDYFKRAARAGLVWPLPEALTDATLEAMLFQPTGGATRRVHAQPDWPTIHRELRRKDVTLALVWEEYRAAHPDGYGYSRFCELYRRWEGRLAPTMRQHHVAGERMFVDYAGATLPVVDAATGTVRHAQLFVAALGASNSSPRRPGRRPCRTGSARTAGRSPGSAACRRRSCPTTSRPASARPASTSRR
jgi:transposase